MTSITISNSVKSIGSYAFSGCTGLKVIYISASTPPSVTYSSFAYVDRFHVPCEALDSYQKADIWKDFKIGCKPLYTLTLSTNNADEGYTSGQISGENIPFKSIKLPIILDEETSITFTAIANYGYRFTGWSDGETAASRTLTMTKDTAITVNFEAITYRLTLNVNKPEMGSVTGAGGYIYNTKVTITATANEGYRFVRWSDGITSATRTVTMTGYITLTAIFEAVGQTALSEVVNTSEKHPVRKVLIDGKVVIVTPDGEAYSAEGKRW